MTSGQTADRARAVGQDRIHILLEVEHGVGVDGIFEEGVAGDEAPGDGVAGGQGRAFILARPAAHPVQSQGKQSDFMRLWEGSGSHQQEFLFCSLAG